MIVGNVSIHSFISRLLAQAIPLHWLLLHVLWLFALLSWGMTDSDSKQDVLRSAWLDAKDGSLSGREQAKAWALREIWRDAGKADHGMKTYIAGKLKKKGGGAPSSEAVRQFFEKVDADDDWFPGKANYDDVGAPSVMTGQQRAALARSAMTMKKEGIEPTYGKVIAACPKAAWNPETKRPFSKHSVYVVLSEDCYDDDPCLPWVHKARFSKRALTKDMMERRLKFADYVLGLHHNNLWFFNNLVWTDLCNSIIPLTQKKANEMALARKANKGWQSPGSELSSENAKGNPESLKQGSWNTMRIWWFPMLARGKLHVDTLDENFPGETPEGAAALVAKVRSSLNVRFQNEVSKPEVLFTDRGRGFFAPNSGAITTEYEDALTEHDLQAFMGDDASRQPGSMQDFLLHETAVSWLRHRLAQSTPKECWKETRPEYGSRLKRCCDEVNRDLDVEGLCKQLPKRLKLLKDTEGDRLKY